MGIGARSSSGRIVQQWRRAMHPMDLEAREYAK
jgi:hypothetical protein